MGRQVYWTPAITVADRSLLDIGDHVIFGHEVRLSSHIIRPTRDDDLLCIVRPVRIGTGAFVGAGVVLGPGAVVQPGELVAAGTIRTGGR